MSEYTKRLRPRLSLPAPKRFTSPDINKTKKPSSNSLNSKRDKRKTFVSAKASIKSIYSNKSKNASIQSSSNEVPTESPQLVSSPLNANKLGKKTNIAKKEVHRLLQKAGVEFVDDVSDCVKAGIKNGFINMEVEKPLDQLILDDVCPKCDAMIIMVTLGDVLYQENREYFNRVLYSDLECSHCKTQLLVHYLCRGNPKLSSARFYNHCSFCPVFGRCVGDYRDRHCDSCGRHYFAGSVGQLLCDICYSSSDDSDEDGFFGSYRSRIPPLAKPIISYIYGEQDGQMANQLNRLVQTMQYPTIANVMDGSESSNDVVKA